MPATVVSPMVNGVAPILVHAERRPHVAERHREVVGIHLPAQQLLQWSALAGRAVDVNRRGRLIGRHEERKALDVVPVRVADEEMDGQRAALELLEQRLPELPDPRAGVEDEDVATAPQLHARGVATVTGSWPGPESRWSRAPPRR